MVVSLGTTIFVLVGLACVPDAGGVSWESAARVEIERVREVAKRMSCRGFISILLNTK
jgi:hypothetical protein